MNIHSVKFHLLEIKLHSEHSNHDNEANGKTNVTINIKHAIKDCIEAAVDESTTSEKSGTKHWKRMITWRLLTLLLL